MCFFPASQRKNVEFCGFRRKERKNRARGRKARRDVPVPWLPRREARRGEASSKKKQSPAADAGLGCSKNRPLRARTGGPGGHFALGAVAPRRPFCPLSAGGKWTPFSAPVGAELTARCRPAFPQKRPRSAGSRFISFPLPFSPAPRLPAPGRPPCPPASWAGNRGTRCRRGGRIWRCSFCSNPSGPACFPPRAARRA